MKKYSILIMAVLLAFTLSGCKSQSGGNSSVNKKAADKYEKHMVKNVLTKRK